MRFEIHSLSDGEDTFVGSIDEWKVARKFAGAILGNLMSNEHYDTDIEIYILDIVTNKKVLSIMLSFGE